MRIPAPAEATGYQPELPTKQCVSQTSSSGRSASIHCSLALAAWRPGSLCLCASRAWRPQPVLGWRRGPDPLPLILCQVCISTGGQVCSPSLPTRDPPLAGFESTSPQSKAISNRQPGAGHWKGWERLASRCQSFRRNRDGLRGSECVPTILPGR